MKISVSLPKKKIDEIFEAAEHQMDYMTKLHAAAVPAWENIEKLNHYPKVSKTTSNYIYQLAIDFDREHHPNCIAGGGWVNSGFSVVDAEHIADWFVEIDEDQITYKETTDEKLK